MVKVVNAMEYVLTLRVCERRNMGLKIDRRAYGKNLFNGTFSNHVGVVCDVFHHDAHTPPLKIKGNFVNFGVRID